MIKPTLITGVLALAAGVGVATWIVAAQRPAYLWLTVVGFALSGVSMFLVARRQTPP